MSNVNVGIPNPAYVTHPTIAAQRRIHVDGFHDSDYLMAIALMEFPDGKVGMAVDGVEATFQQLIRVHDVLTKVTAEVDRRLQKHALTVPGER
jgi:hypothetical protein